MVDNAMQGKDILGYLALLLPHHQVGSIVEKLLILLSLGTIYFCLPGINTGERDGGAAVFLKPGVPQPSCVVLSYRMGSGGNIRWVYRYEAEVDLYKSIPSCKQEDSELWYYYVIRITQRI